MRRVSSDTRQTWLRRKYGSVYFELFEALQCSKETTLQQVIERDRGHPPVAFTVRSEVFERRVYSLLLVEISKAQPRRNDIFGLDFR